MTLGKHGFTYKSQWLTHDSLRAILDMVKPSIQNWPIYQVRTLPTWTSKSGKFVLMGDAAHAMAFYLSMGVSMAVEDAAALTECLSLHTTPRDGCELPLPAAMSLFESVRKPRAEAVRDASLHAGNMLHAPPGEKRTARDEAVKVDGTIISERPESFWVELATYGIADRRIRDWCYAYDVVDDIIERWKGTKSSELS